MLITQQVFFFVSAYQFAFLVMDFSIQGETRRLLIGPIYYVGPLDHASLRWSPNTNPQYDGAMFLSWLCIV